MNSHRPHYSKAVDCQPNDQALLQFFSAISTFVIIYFSLFCITFSGFADYYFIDLVYSHYYYPSLALGILIFFVFYRPRVLKIEIEIMSSIFFLQVLFFASVLSYAERSFSAVAISIFLPLSVLFFLTLLKVGQSLAFLLAAVLSYCVSAIGYGVYLYWFVDVGVFLRATGWFGNPNRFATVASFGVIISLFFLLAPSSSIKRKSIGFLFFHSAVICFMFSAIILSGSRANFIASTAAALVMFALRLRQLAAKISFGAFAVFLVYLAFWATRYADIQFWERMRSDETRIERYRAAWQLLVDSDVLSFLFGRGYGFFLDSVGGSAESLYSSLLINHGLVYTVGFLAVIGFAFFHVRNKGGAKFIVQPFIVFLLVDGFFATGGIAAAPQNMFLGLCIAIAVWATAPAIPSAALVKGTDGQRWYTRRPSGVGGSR